MKLINQIDTSDVHSLDISQARASSTAMKTTNNSATHELASYLANALTSSLDRTKTVANPSITKGISATVLCSFIGSILIFSPRTVLADDTALGTSPLITYTLQQVRTNRYLDAYGSNAQDYRLVTRPAQDNNTQRWKLTPLGNDIYTIYHPTSQYQSFCRCV